MTGWIQRYVHWLHTRWPAGTVEKLPVVAEDGSTHVAGLYVVGDLTGVPLLKFSAETGALAVHTIAEDPSFERRSRREDVRDVAIVGAGVSGFSAALECRRRGLDFDLFEAAEPFSTIVNFPKAKPIFTYPTEMTPAGELQFHDKSDVKEGLLEDLREQTVDAGIDPVPVRVERVERRGGVLEVHHEPRGDGSGESARVTRAHRVIIAIGRSGNFRELGVRGEDKDKVSNRLHDPKDFAGQQVLVVGGGDSALETAIALTTGGAGVTLSYRKPELSRPKPENVARLEELAGDGRLELMLGSKLKEIRDAGVVVADADGEDVTIPNDAVFAMIGREPPLDFFRRSGVRISGEWTLASGIGLASFLTFCFWLYHWKADYNIPFGLKDAFNSALGWDPGQLWTWLAQRTGSYLETEGTLGHTLKISASGRSFYYTLVYALCVVVFGVRRIRRRRTPYVTLQTWTLTAIQVIPLFLLPEILLPWMGHNGWFDSGVGARFADTFFPEAGYGHGREYWRAYGFVLAWPLMAWNWFTDQPLWGWLVVGFLQTFVAIPLLIHRWGKGAYCGWICSCGALAETMGDAQRHKMPHGPTWNRVNLVGQVFLAFAVVLMVFRVGGWILPGDDWADRAFRYLARGDGLPLLNWSWMVDMLWAGILGVGLYFHFSGRVWCRFACPLAALMHVYARFSSFRILADKKKCISCNVCTSVCHQGIDVMSFANKGLGMEDPQCVRCSACVQSCPTGVLTFGRVDRRTGNVLGTDRLAASPVQMAESRGPGPAER